LVFYQKWPIESDPNIKGMKDVEGWGSFVCSISLKLHS
jgi:hypothetical protein